MSKNNPEHFDAREQIAEYEATPEDWQEYEDWLDGQDLWEDDIEDDLYWGIEE